MNEKIKAFFKKYWGIVAAVISSVATALFYKLLGRTNQRTDNFGNSLDQLTTGLGRAEDSISNLRDNNREATDLINQQRSTINDIRERHTSIEDSSQGIGDSIQRLKDIVEREREKTTE